MTQPEQEENPTPQPQPIANDNGELAMPCRLHGRITKPKKFWAKFDKVLYKHFYPVAENDYHWAYDSYLHKFDYTYKKRISQEEYAIIGYLKLFPEENRFTLTVNATERAILAMRYLKSTFNRLNERTCRFESIDWYKVISSVEDTAFIERIRKLPTFFEGMDIEPYHVRNQKMMELAKKFAPSKSQEEASNFLDALEKLDEGAIVQNIEIDSTIPIKSEIDRLHFTFLSNQNHLYRKFMGEEVGGFFDHLKRAVFEEGSGENTEN